MSVHPRHPRRGAGDSDAGSPRAPSSSWRGWSVIVCPRRGRPLQLADPMRVYCCDCQDVHRPPLRMAPREQDVPSSRYPEMHRRAYILKSYPVDGQVPRHLGPSLSPVERSTVQDGATSSALNGHLGQIGAPPRPPGQLRFEPHNEHADVKLARRTSLPPNESQSAWMPTTRRLLLEPAPRRLPIRGPAYVRPYGPGREPADPRGPPNNAVLRTQCSAFRRVEPSLAPPPFYDVVYGMPLASVSVYGGLKLRLSATADGRPPGTPSTCPPPGPRAQVLRVLRPDELEVKVPAMPTLAQPAAKPAWTDSCWSGTATAPRIPDTPAADVNKEDGKKAAVDGAAEDDAACEAKQDADKSEVAVDVKARRQWLLHVVQENFNEQIGVLVDRFVRRPRHDKSVRRVPGVGRKVNVNLQEYWRRNTGEDRHMKTKDLLGVFSKSGMDWKSFQKWLTKELHFMPSCAKLTALSLDIYQKYWSTDWDIARTTG